MKWHPNPHQRLIFRKYKWNQHSQIHMHISFKKISLPIYIYIYILGNLYIKQRWKHEIKTNYRCNAIACNKRMRLEKVAAFTQAQRNRYMRFEWVLHSHLGFNYRTMDENACRCFSLALHRLTFIKQSHCDDFIKHTHYITHIHSKSEHRLICFKWELAHFKDSNRCYASFCQMLNECCFFSFVWRCCCCSEEQWEHYMGIRHWP